jgi:hypothetical protein
LEVYIVYNTSFPMYLKAVHIPQQVSLYILYGAIVHKLSPRTDKSREHRNVKYYYI